MSDCLFAYGTLQPGRVPAEVAPLAAKLRPVGRGFVHGVLYDLGRYPGAVPNASAKGKIAGTVMELPEEENMLARLDAYEGFDPKSPDTSEYVRERQMVELADGGKLECWFYRYNREPRNAPIVKDGEWRKWANCQNQNCLTQRGHPKRCQALRPRQTALSH
jgi:gamma-glutamylcyclotransferase (GGCT)/AIG2-like uncharacterized protein YtfP